MRLKDLFGCDFFVVKEPVTAFDVGFGLECSGNTDVWLLAECLSELSHTIAQSGITELTAFEFLR